MPESFPTQFATIAIAHLLAVVSPGPDFAVVVKQSLGAGRRAAVWTSVGIGSGILLHVGYSLFGLALFLSRSPALFEAIRYAGAAYLLFLGLSSFRPGSAGRMAVASGKSAVESPLRSWTVGFMTNALNPKATLFFLAIFTAVITPGTPLTWQLFYGFWMSGATMIWFSLVALLFTSPAIRERFLRAGHWFTRATGVVLIGLGLRILLT